MKKIYKIVLGGIMAVFLGAIGSGVWQYIFDPVVSSSSRALLNLATLGIDSFKNDLYKEIAKGFHEQASTSLYDQFNFLFAVATIAFGLALVLYTKQLVQRRMELLEDVARLEKGIERQIPQLSEMREALIDTKPNRLLVVSYVFLAISIIFLSARFVSEKSNRYVNEAITYYCQSKKIVAPYIDEKDSLKLDSDFSLVESSKDYETLITHIRGIAEKNSVKLPKFDLW